MKHCRNLFLMMLLWLSATPSVWAADCYAVWPAATSASTASPPALPVFTGASAMNFPSGFFTKYRNMGAGDFHFNGISGTGELRITSGASSRVYFNSANLTIANNVDFNANGDAQDLIVLVNGNLTINTNGQVRAFIYATGNVSVAAVGSFQGAITAGGTISNTSGKVISYSTSTRDAIASGSLCSHVTAVQYAAPVCGHPNRVVMGYNSLSAGYSLETLANPASYSLSTTGGSTPVISNAWHDPDKNQVVIQTATNLLGYSANNKYTLRIPGVQDANGGVPPGSDYFYYSSVETGLVGEFWGNSSLSGTPSVIRVDNLSQDFGGDFFCDLLLFLCSENASARWKGFIKPTSTGSFAFQTVTNDGSRLWVDNMTTPIIDYWGTNGTSAVTRTSVARALTANNYYQIRQDFYYDECTFFGFPCSLTEKGEIILRWNHPAAGAQVVLPQANLSNCVDAPVNATLASFVITVPATASACGSAAVTITAMGNDGNIKTNYTGTITLGTSRGHGDWLVTSAGGVLTNGAADDGIATYSFVTGDNGVITLALTNAHADVTSVSVNDITAAVSSTSSNISFQRNGIRINEGTARDWDVIAGRDHTFEVEYLVLNPDGLSGCGTADFNGNAPLKFWRTAVGANPVGAVAPVISNGSSTVSLGTSATSLTLAIAGGRGTFTLGSSDVGEFDLTVRDDASGFAQDAGGNPVVVQGNQFRGSSISVRPFGYYARAVDNPAAVDANGAVYQKAGDNFTLQVTGVLYQAADDANADGIPDGHDDGDPLTLANLADNMAAPHAGIGETPTVTVALVAPAGGSAGSVSGSLGVFSGGIASGSFAYSEVGIMEISVQSDASYFSSNRQVMGKSGHVGRFVPHHFDISDNSVGLTHGWLDANSNGSNDWDCAFTYQGQGFAMDSNPVLTITALNRANLQTENYVGAFNKFSAGAGELVDAGLPVDSGATLVAPGAIGAAKTELTPGVFAVTVTGYTAQPYGLRYEKASAPAAGDVPFDASLELIFPDAMPGSLLTDSDSVCYSVDTNSDGVADQCRSYRIDAIDGTAMRYGRLILENNFGAETSSLDLAYRTEIWQAVGGNQTFVTHTDDGNACTGTSGITIGFSDYQGNLVDGDTSASVGALVQGEGTVTLGAPGAGNDGQVKVDLLGPAFLQFDFDLDGTPEDASATATFGVYEGRRPMFYKREGFR